MITGSFTYTVLLCLYFGFLSRICRYLGDFSRVNSVSERGSVACAVFARLFLSVVSVFLTEYYSLLAHPSAYFRQCFFFDCQTVLILFLPAVGLSLTLCF